MWHSIVIKHGGQSMQEACANPEQFLCSYDGAIYGEREAKKMAKRVGKDYIFSGGPGQPRHVKTPMEPFGEDEFKEVEKALDRGLVPPGMDLASPQALGFDDRPAIEIDIEALIAECREVVASIAATDSPEERTIFNVEGLERDWLRPRVERELATPVISGEASSARAAFEDVQSAKEQVDQVNQADSQLAEERYTAAVSRFEDEVHQVVEEMGLAPVVDRAVETILANIFTDDPDG
jgi:hypothetical protein